MVLSKLINTGKSIFTLNDIAAILGIDNKKYLRVMLSRMAKRKELVRLQKGVYTYIKNYNPFELANKLKTPSYVSLERVLFDNNIIFQDVSKTITSVSNNHYSRVVDGTNFTYNKIRDDILYNPLGVIVNQNARTASVERAICDMVYLSKNYYFDKIDKTDKKKLSEISRIYNKRVINEIKAICST